MKRIRGVKDAFLKNDCAKGAGTESDKDVANSLYIRFLQLSVDFPCRNQAQAASTSSSSLFTKQL